MENFILTLEDLGNTDNRNIETIFAQANGFMGVRASLPLLSDESCPGSFVNGFYETSPISYGENAFGYAKNHETMVKLFDFRSLKLTIASEKTFLLRTRDLRLDMKNGLLNESYVYETLAGKKIQIDLESFTSHADRTVYAQKITIRALNFSGKIQLEKKVTHLMPTHQAIFDSRVRDATRELAHSENRYTTLNSKRSLYTHFESFSKMLDLTENECFSFTQINQLAWQNHFEPHSYEALKAEQSRIFQAFWDSSDIKIDGDERLQKGIRLNLYHLFNSAGRDGKTNFAAKGLTGEGYEGHYFWDTEMYLLPFFIYTQPEIAKALLTYRLSILPQAKARAKELGFVGATFAWRTQSGQETSPYYPAGTAQFHINADIVYAFQLYEKVTGDTAFIKKAREVIYETARFWSNYGFESARGFELHEVTGPDEYTTLVNNNYYTNKMAQNNLFYAAEIAEKFSENVLEAKHWQKQAEQMYFGYDEKRQITKQDDSFLDKEVWDFAGTLPEKYPLLLHYHPLKIYKHQVLKQADTVLAHMLFGGDAAQIARDFDFYEPLTTHDSSLSRAIHGVVASQLGRDQQAYAFFSESATMDLSDLQGNAAQGIHAANMGGSWLGLVYGFAGLHFEGKKLKVENHLPKQIKGLKFKLHYQGELQEIELKQKE